MEALEEAITISTGVWAEEQCTFSSADFSASDERIFPPPRQRPGRPFIIAGGGKRFTLRLVVQYAQARNYGASDTTVGARTSADIARKVAAPRNHRADLGRSYDASLRTQSTSWIFPAETWGRGSSKAEAVSPHPSHGVATVYPRRR